MSEAFQKLWAACQDAAVKAKEQGGCVSLFNINRETYLLWKANAGNAKARRRWRRRDIPNSQKAIGGGCPHWSTPFGRADCAMCHHGGLAPVTPAEVKLARYVP